MDAVRRWGKWLARTPFHPQWLLGPRKLPNGVDEIAGRVLDIGAADRWMERQLPAAAEYVALDYPPTGSVLYGARPSVFGNGARLPFVDGCFDAVICLEVLEHVADPANVMNEIGRVLALGGKAWISMPFLYPLHDAPFDFQRYTAFGLQRDVQRAGLEIVSLRRSGHAIRTAGLLMCVALAGAVYSHHGIRRLLLLPIAGFLVLIVNVLAWCISLVWPDWSHMALGHDLEVTKK